MISATMAIPFIWDGEDRRHRMARLDALFFHLYGIDRNAAYYILNTFPIVREHDEKQFGRFRTRDPRPRLHERHRRRQPRHRH